MIKSEVIFRERANSFLNEFFDLLVSQKLNLNKNELDHICYRVSSEEEYEQMKTFISSFSSLLIESEVGGRNIATYKLEEPIVYNSRSIYLIELPSPKKGKVYSCGFEHCEFVISESFKEFAEIYSSLDFNWAGADKDFNPELRLMLNKSYSVKFHHMSLERVIEIEKGLTV